MQRALACDHQEPKYRNRHKSTAGPDGCLCTVLLAAASQDVWVRGCTSLVGLPVPEEADGHCALMLVNRGDLARSTRPVMDVHRIMGDRSSPTFAAAH
jgi:hypothetical protein